MKLTTFMIKVNGQKPVKYATKTTVYNQVVLEAYGRLKMPFPCEVEIWAPHLLPEYGPYFYRVDYFPDYGCPAVLNSRKPTP